MTLQKVDTRNIVLIGMIAFAAAMRLLTFEFQFLSNFTPVGVIALFGGAYFTEKWKAFLVPLLALFVSDMLINTLYHFSPFAISYWMYLCFAIMVFIGTLIKKVNVANVALASIAAVLVHWLIMDMPFLYGTLYPHTWTGYGQSLVKAIPFERNMILGDAIYGIILFGGFELAKHKYVFLRSKSKLAL